MKNEEFMEQYAQIVTNFTVDFAKEFCENGKINWPKLVEFNSVHREKQQQGRKKRK